MFSKAMVRDAAASFALLLLGACAGDPSAVPDVAFVGGHPVLAVTGVANIDAQIAVGDSVFRDKNLSRFRNQSCASCHADS